MVSRVWRIVFCCLSCSTPLPQNIGVGTWGRQRWSNKLRSCACCLFDCLLFGEPSMLQKFLHQERTLQQFTQNCSQPTSFSNLSLQWCTNLGNRSLFKILSASAKYDAGKFVCVSLSSNSSE
jgi:hypothetical protein